MKRNLRSAIGYLAVFSMVMFTITSFAATPQKKILYTFTGGTDGAYPYAGFAVGAGGILYSTTSGGGLHYCGYPCGVVFSFTPPQPGGSWTETPNRGCVHRYPRLVIVARSTGGSQFYSNLHNGWCRPVAPPWAAPWANGPMFQEIALKAA